MGEGRLGLFCGCQGKGLRVPISGTSHKPEGMFVARQVFVESKELIQALSQFSDMESRLQPRRYVSFETLNEH